MNSFRYVVAVLFWIGCPPTLLWWFVLHPFAEFWRRRGLALTYWVLGTGFLLTAAGLFQVRDFVLVTDYGTNPALAVTGLLPLGVSMAIGFKRKKYLSFKTLAGLPELQQIDPSEANLVTEGIYGRIRHPRYVEVSLGCVGWALILNYREIYVLTAVSLLAIYLIVVIEEKELRRRFGEAYVEYAARVPRFIPRDKASSAGSA